YVAGHADYTPMHFGDRRRETSWAHQIASAAIFTSPLLVYGAHPANILANPAVDLIKSIPSVWDETVVLPDSAIGEMAAFARRRGRVWFVAVMNGPIARNIQVPLSFLAPGKHAALLVSDRMEDSGAVNVDSRSMQRNELLRVELRPAGGLLGRFS